ncbi:MAG: pyridoxamine 5'-phosphate oxidase [Oceanococcus sp.]
MSDKTFDLPPSTPFVWLKSWLDDARTLPLNEPLAMNLATVSARGTPSSRIVLFKGLVNDDIRFFTNYASRKGEQLEHNQNAALCFWWDPLMRQIRIEGHCEKLDDESSDAYFESRARGSQLGAWASQQSQTVENRGQLEQSFADVEKRFDDASVSRPPHWGGYALKINRIEFWEGRDNRFHDRVQYLREQQAWAIQRLQP